MDHDAKNISTTSITALVGHESPIYYTDPVIKKALDEPDVKTRVYKRRWLILLLFCLYSTSNAYHWLQYSIIADITQYYYQIDAELVDWTSLVYLAFYIPLIFPASWLLKRRGLRQTVLLGAIGTALGAWIKCGSARRDLFPVAFVGQSFIALSQIFVLGIPAQLAAVWFGPNEVSSACAIGVFGNQVGIALGFVIPTEVIIMRNDTDEITRIEEIGRGFQIFNYSAAAFATVLLLLIIIFFADRPPIPPSVSSLAGLETKENYYSSIKCLVKNKNFVMLLIAYGLNVGAFYAISTLLNQVFLIYFPAHNQDAGRIGLIIIVFGLIGSVACGFFLDKTHKFKETSVALNIAACLSMFAFTFIMKAYNVALVYVVAALLGFFMTGFLPVGFEFAVELTYPESEGISSGLLNASAALFGIIFTTTEAKIMDTWNDVYANVSLAGALILGTVLTAAIKSDLRRQRALEEK